MKELALVGRGTVGAAQTIHPCHGDYRAKPIGVSHDEMLLVSTAEM